jgi:hypothetical protein
MNAAATVGGRWLLLFNLFFLSSFKACILICHVFLMFTSPGRRAGVFHVQKWQIYLYPGVWIFFHHYYYYYHY